MSSDPSKPRNGLVSHSLRISRMRPSMARPKHQRLTSNEHSGYLPEDGSTGHSLLTSWPSTLQWTAHFFIIHWLPRLLSYASAVLCIYLYADFQCLHTTSSAGKWTIVSLAQKIMKKPCAVRISNSPDNYFIPFFLLYKFSIAE